MLARIRVYLLVKAIQVTNAVLSELTELLALEALGTIKKAIPMTKGLIVVDNSHCDLDVSIGDTPSRASLNTWSVRVEPQP
jgi:hypothetical protein